MAKRGPRRLGVFGGTFDPPHLGHLVTAVNVRHELDLDVVLLVVANEPWQKSDTRAVSDPADRLAMVEAAVEGVDGIEACPIEIERGGPSFTADTLEDLHRDDPDAELFVVLGRDAAQLVDTWERIEVVRSTATLVVVDRPGAVEQPLPEGFRWRRVVVPRLEVSSTDLRARAREGRPLDFLLLPPVIATIAERGLYGGGRHG